MPTNKKFGITFSIIFILISVFFYLSSKLNFFYIFLSISLAMFFLSFLLSEALYVFNLIWFKFGLILSKYISPIILTFIFYGIFLPFSLFVRFNKTKKFWIENTKKIKVSKEQF